LSIFALRSNWRFALPVVWVANTWGFVDLLNGVRGVLQLNVPSFNLATLWYVYTFYAPLVVVSHLTIFWILIKRRSSVKPELDAFKLEFDTRLAPLRQSKPCIAPSPN